MLYVHVVRSFNEVVSAWVATDSERRMDGVENRNDWRTYEGATKIAAVLGPRYQATDSGPYVSPRFDIIKLPQVGDPASYTFNGDYYPAGYVKSISAGPAFRRITTEDSNGARKTFSRRHVEGKPVGGAWIADGTWSLVFGHASKLNPEF
jgi:hypothetical protein